MIKINTLHKITANILARQMTILNFHHLASYEAFSIDKTWLTKIVYTLVVLYLLRFGGMPIYLIAKPNLIERKFLNLSLLPNVSKKALLIEI